jgi:hypothetical protein
MAAEVRRPNGGSPVSQQVEGGNVLRSVVVM